MAKAFALTTLHVCREPGQTGENGRTIKPAKIDIVPAGKVTNLSAAQMKEFLAAGAVRVATKVDLAAADDHGGDDADDEGTGTSKKAGTSGSSAGTGAAGTDNGGAS
ncbi:MAG: hypothetical protein AB7U62_04365 [Pseudolabrys sp.]